MPVNPDIALGYKPVQLPDMQDFALRRAQIMNYMSEDATRRRALMEQGVVKNMLSLPNANPDDPAFLQELAKRGGKTATDWITNYQQGKQQRLLAEKEEAAARKEKALTSMIGIANMNSWDEADAKFQEGVANQTLDQAWVDSQRALRDTMPFNQYQVQMMRQAAKLADPAAAAQEQVIQTDLGGEHVISARPEIGGDLVELRREAKTESPGEKSTRTVQMMKPFAFQDAAGNVTTISPDGRKIIEQFPAVGRPTSDYQKTQEAGAKGVADIDMLVPMLEEANKPGGIIEKAGGGGVTAAQTAASRAIGVTTPEMEAQGQLDVLADLVLKLVPRFEGPQSDKDTASYRAAAGKLTDQFATKGERAAAVKTILSIYDKRRDQFVNAQGERAATGTRQIPTPGDPGAPPPAGARVIERGADGKLKFKQ